MNPGLEYSGRHYTSPENTNYSNLWSQPGALVSVLQANRGHSSVSNY